MRNALSANITASAGIEAGERSAIEIGTPSWTLLENTVAMPNTVCSSVVRWQSFFARIRPKK